MFRYRRLGYVALNVSDLDRASAWYQFILGLKLNERASRDSLHFDVGTNPDGLLLYRSSRPGLKRIGWEVESEDQISGLTAEFDRRALTWHTMTREECDEVGARRGARLVEPITGAVLDFYTRRSPAAERPATTKLVKMRHLGHVVLGTPRYREAIRFYTDVLNFKTSDEIDGRINLMRCFPNPYHHSFGIAHADSNSFHHLNLMVTDEEDLSNARQRFSEHDVPIVWQGTHPPSGNTFLFFLDPDGLSLEYGHGMELFPERGARDARVFPPKPESFDSTGAQRDDRTASVGAIETP